MISGPRIDVKIGGRSFSIPRFRDTDTTYYIAKLLHERLKVIEAKSGRIDTQAFAIEAAMSFAYELMESEETLEAETKEMLSALGKLSEDLRSICREFDVKAAHIDEDDQ